MTVTSPLPPPRPDAAERLARLNAMKRRATGLLALAAVTFVAASIYEGQLAWVGYVRATAEAALIGGLADWFAVTALFRRPLGLPIPHTAIVATQKDRIGRILGNFVQTHFLSHEVLAARLRGLRVSERAAAWLSQPDNAGRIARQVAAGLAKTLEAVPDDEVQALLHEGLTHRLRTARAAPALGKVLSLMVVGNRHHELLSKAVLLAAQSVQDNWAVIRRQVRAESPWWIPGVVDDTIARRIVKSIERVLLEASADPRHPLRTAFDTVLRDFVERLQHEPDVIARAEALKDDWLADPQTADLSVRLWDATRQTIANYAARPEGSSEGPLERGIVAFGKALAANQRFLNEIDDVVIELAATALERNRQAVADLIEQTFAAWDPRATAQRVELAVGRDLQFVRINGTLVGGLVGLALYTVLQLSR